MRPPVPLLPRRTCLVAAIGLLAACSRDLEVPAETTAPRIDALSPASAHAGERLVLTGSGFDGDAQANTVQFARASARAESAAGGTLVVRVPPDAGRGRITVATSGGISAPSAQEFEYRGLGELRTGVVSNEIALLHEPYRLVATRDDTYLHSDLLLGVVRYGDPAFVATQAVAMDAAPSASPNGAALLLESGEAGSRLVLEMGPMYGTRTKDIAYAGVGPVVAMRAGGGLPEAAAVLRADPADATSWTVALHQLSDLEPVPSWPSAGETGVPQPLPGVAEVRGCADAGGGDLACLARASTSGPLQLARVRLAPPLGVTWLPATAVPIVENRLLLADPLCGDPVHRRAVVALTDGSIVTAQLDAATPYYYEAAATGSRTPVRSLTCYAGGAGTYAIVAKPDDDLLLKLQPFAPGYAEWAVEIPRATQAAVWCNDASCANGVIHAAGEADNRVFVLDMFDGKVLARRSFDVLPGRVDDPDALVDLTAAQGAASFATADAPDVPKLAFVTTAPRGMIWMPVTARRQTGLYPHFRASDALAVAPGVTGEYWMLLDDLAFDGNSLSAAAQLGADADYPYAHAATVAGLETLDYDLGSVAVSPVADALFTSLGRFPDGRIHASLRSGGEWSVRAWTVEEAAAGAPAGAAWTSPGTVTATAVLDGELFAFYWDGEGQLHAVALDGALSAASDAVLADAFFSVLAVSPNGRTFVSWDLQPYSTDTSVVIWSAEAAAGFPRLATIPVHGQVSGVAFDGTGEALYVVTRGPDRVLVLR